VLSADNMLLSGNMFAEKPEGRKSCDAVSLFTCLHIENWCGHPSGLAASILFNQEIFLAVLFRLFVRKHCHLATVFFLL
jgi:hypothetical protein